MDRRRFGLQGCLNGQGIITPIFFLFQALFLYFFSQKNPGLKPQAFSFFFSFRNNLPMQVV